MGVPDRRSDARNTTAVVLSFDVSTLCERARTKSIRNAFASAARVSTPRVSLACNPAPGPRVLASFAGVRAFERALVLGFA